MEEEKIYIADEQERFVIVESKVRLIASKICSHLGVSQHTLDVTFVTAEQMATINSEHRGKESSTDVLSFPQYHWDKPLTFSENPIELDDHARIVPEPLGDVVISLEDALDNAKSIGQGLDEEVAFLIVHGVLHLCGHDHEDPEEEAVMVQQQKLCMEVLQQAWPSCVRLTTEDAT